MTQTTPSSPNTAQFDLLIIGGGVNGVGIARDAAGRGLKVLLVEKDDLASGTSSASTKLIHGGLRYLEQYEFRLVRESLKERETLLDMAPHIIWPMRFVLPHHKGLRPRWMLRLGLFLYDHLGPRKKLPATQSLNLRTAPEGAALKDSFTHGFAYADCWVDDARLVVLTARDAEAKGAEIRTRTACTGIATENGLWTATLSDGSTITAGAVVNAAGPWVAQMLAQAQGKTIDRAGKLRLVKGSHIIVPKLFDGHQAYIFQNSDGRILFAIPYEGDFTLLGTTDVPVDGPEEAKASEAEIAYICEAVSEYLAAPVSPDMVVATYSGIRPLYDEHEGEAAATVTRDYMFDLQTGDGLPPLLSIYGGKVTTHRKLAEHAMEKLQPHMGSATEAWTKGAALPGAFDGSTEDFTTEMAALYPWLPKETLARLVRSYGTDIPELLANAGSLEGLGRDFGAGLTEAELIWLRDKEWARTGEDVLWRRSKLTLHMSDAQKEAVAEWMDANAG